MRTNKKLDVESLERREVFSVAPGLEGLAPDAAGNHMTTEALVCELNQEAQDSSRHAQGQFTVGIDIFASGIPERFGGGPLSHHIDQWIAAGCPND